DFHKKFFHWTEAPKDYTSHNSIIEKLVKALVLQRKITLIYQGPGRPEKSHTVAPLSLLMYKRALYLIGRKDADPEDGGKPRDLTFAVERVREVGVSSEGFSYPSEYEPERRFQSS